MWPPILAWLLLTGVAAFACVVTSGVVPDSGVAASDKDSAPVAISEVAPIIPHAFVPGTNIDDSTRQISLSHGDFDAQTDDFGSPPKKFEKTTDQIGD